MPFRTLDALDDATFDVTNVAVVGSSVRLLGWVDERDTGIGSARLPVTLTVPAAVDVVVDHVGGTGELVLERIEVDATTVTLVGVMPCTVVITTSTRSEVLLDVQTTPIAVRRWGRWRPWDGHVTATLDYSVVRRRLGRAMCTSCRHCWGEHPGAWEEGQITCGECEYELEHGELPPGRDICARRVPGELLDAATSAERLQAESPLRRLVARTRRLLG